jgi:hypothetical protein
MFIYGIYLFVANHKTFPQPSPSSSASVSQDFYGVSFGRPYRIANGTLSKERYHGMLQKLDETKKLLYQQMQAAPTISPSTRSIIVRNNFGPKSLSQLRFVHIPKTGTTFAATVIHYCCQHLNDIHLNVLTKENAFKLWDLDPSCRSCLKQPASANGDYWAHFPFLDGIDNGHSVTMLRDPLKRLSSQISHMRGLMSQMKSFGVSDEDSVALSKIMTNKFLWKITDTEENNKVIVTSPKVAVDSFLLSLSLNDSNKSISNANNKVYPTEFMDVTQRCYSEISAIDEELSKVSAVNVTIRNRLQKHRTKLMRSCRWSMVALYPGLLGCQTRMIIGRPCFDRDHPITIRDIQFAKDRLVKDFVFVGRFMSILFLFLLVGQLLLFLFAGIQEHWNESISLFHTEFGGALYLDELLVTRKAQSPREEAEVYESLKILKLVDPIDQEIYSFALNHFKNEIKKHNISPPY